MLVEDQKEVFCANSLAEIDEISQEIEVLENSLTFFKGLRDDYKKILQLKLEVNKKVRETSANVFVNMITREKSLLHKKRVMTRKIAQKEHLYLPKKAWQEVSFEKLTEVENIIFGLENNLSLQKKKLDIYEEGLRTLEETKSRK